MQCNIFIYVRGKGREIYKGGQRECEWQLIQERKGGGGGERVTWQEHLNSITPLLPITDSIRHAPAHSGDSFLDIGGLIPGYRGTLSWIQGDSFLDTGGLIPRYRGTLSGIQGDSPLGDSFLDTGGLPPLGDSFLDTGGLPFGGTHSWEQGDSPLGDSFLDAGELPFGGLYSWIQGDSHPLGNSFLCGGVTYTIPREDSFLPTKATFFLFLPTEGLLSAVREVLPNLRRTHSCLLQISPCQFEERDLFLPHEFFSCPLRERLPTQKCLIPGHGNFLPSPLTQSRRSGSSLFWIKGG
jgi:hypothetical protein